jgi:tRNA A37 threonylcarbamoyladenosine modification protein TsaB
MIKIYLDSTQKENLIYLIQDNRISRKYQFTTDYHSDSQLLSEFDSFLKGNKIDLEDISTLLVNLGPGGFTGTRNGITLANSLKLARPELKLVGLSNPNDQQIIAEGLEPAESLSPIYSNLPNITNSKISY